jgi:hypothetical protein
MAWNACNNLPLLLLGIIAVGWGVWLIWRPESLRPGTPLYRWIYWRWHAWRRRAHGASEELSRRQVQYYGAVLVVLGGLMGLLMIFLWR